MRAFAFLVSLLFLGCGGAGQRNCQGAGCGGGTERPVAGGGSGGGTALEIVQPGPTAWIGGSPLQTRWLVGSDGQTYLGVWLDAPSEAPVTEARPPMALSLVIDTSGSMAGDKINFARTAAASFLASLREGDIVSVHSFSDGVRELAPPTTVSPGSRAALLGMVSQLQANGGTNMYDGLRAGIGRLSMPSDGPHVRRVIVVSDGRANIGPSDPGSLGTLAAQGTEYGIQVTAIGVGLDYDEHTLASLAVKSSGRVYHLQEPQQMASILEQELELLNNTVATNAAIEIVPSSGVQLFPVDSASAQMANGGVRIPIGSVYAGQRREFLLRANVDTSNVGARSLGVARLTYAAPSTRQATEQRVDLRYEVTNDGALVSNSVVARVQAIVAGDQAVRAQLAAADLLNQGQSGQAVQMLDDAEEQLRGAAQAMPASPARDHLMEQATRVRRGRERAASARSAPASRAAALENHDMAYESAGY